MVHQPGGWRHPSADIWTLPRDNGAGVITPSSGGGFDWAVRYIDRPDDEAITGYDTDIDSAKASVENLL